MFLTDRCAASGSAGELVGAPVVEGQCDDVAGDRHAGDAGVVGAGLPDAFFWPVLFEPDEAADRYTVSEREHCTASVLCGDVQRPLMHPESDVVHRFPARWLEVDPSCRDGRLVRHGIDLVAGEAGPFTLIEFLEPTIWLSGVRDSHGSQCKICGGDCSQGR